MLTYILPARPLESLPFEEPLTTAASGGLPTWVGLLEILGVIIIDTWLLSRSYLVALILKSLGACLMRVALHQKNGSIFDHRAIPTRPSVSWLLASHAVAEPSQGHDEL